MSAVTKNPKICWMCGKTVNLEECKVDANGLPVHENCYVTKLTQTNSPQPIRKRPRP